MMQLLPTPPHIPSLWLRRSAADRKSYVGMVRRAVARRQGLGLPLDASEARCRRELGLPADASEADCVAAEVRNAHAAAAPSPKPQGQPIESTCQPLCSLLSPLSSLLLPPEVNSRDTKSASLSRRLSCRGSVALHRHKTACITSESMDCIPIRWP